MKRKLGNSGLEVAPLCFGGNVFGWTVDEAAGFRLLDALVDAGLNFIDTADVYSRWVQGNVGGESETIIGNWLKKSGKRQSVIIGTKVGLDMPSGKGLSREHILQAVDDSLRRLQTDYIDLYQSHRDDPNVPIHEPLETYGELIKQGKVRAIGASNFSAERLTAALDASEKHSLPRYESLQPHYNLYERQDFESAAEAVCFDNKLGVISYYSLASGFLSGKYRSKGDLSKSPRGKGIEKYLNDRGIRILECLDVVAEETNSTPARVSLAWLMARPSVTAPIASATSLEQLHDLIEATKLQLEPSAINRLNQASAY